METNQQRLRGGVLKVKKENLPWVNSIYHHQVCDRFHIWVMLDQGLVVSRTDAVYSHYWLNSPEAFGENTLPPWSAVSSQNMSSRLSDSPWTNPPRNCLEDEMSGWDIRVECRGEGLGWVCQGRGEEEGRWGGEVNTAAGCEPQRLLHVWTSRGEKSLPVSFNLKGGAWPRLLVH